MSLAAAALLLALGQDPHDSTIIVEGQRPISRKEALRTVTDMTVITESQVARFHDPVCPLVIGMLRPAAVRVERRMRDVARQVGAPVAPERCEANLLVLITEDATALIQDIRVNRPRWLEGINPSEKRRLHRDTPATAWSVSSIRNEDGHRPRVGETMGRSRVESSSFSRMVGGGTALDGVRQLRVRTNSFTRNSSRQHLDGSVVVIEADAAEGLTLRQVADYAAMRGLANIRPPANISQLDSILSVVEERHSRPKELTAFDRRYLRGLYKNLGSRGFESSVFERQRLARAIAEEN